ncbi:MAG: (d)CMP kinase [Chloroflexota bacterium]|nr:(d)CMP kinase [Chloroflexota bacterium]
MAAERLQKLLAQAGVASRRGAEALIAAGRVRVNGAIATLGMSADPSLDAIEVDGTALELPTSYVHYAIHKPSGYLSSAHDERGRRSVVSLLRAESDRRLWPAGRLDVESEGLMLLTDDGAWANRVLHPRYGIEREYAVLAESMPGRATLRGLVDGVDLDDGPARLLAARAAAPPREVRREPGERGSWLRVRVGEGRKREVRRLFEAVDQRVLRLVRTRIGPLGLDGLLVGEWRRLEPAVVASLAGARPRITAGATLTIAIDGPSGAGKSTVGYALAQRIGATFVDTGLMYRALTLAALEAGVDVEDAEALGALAHRSRIDVRRPAPEEHQRLETVLLNGRDVTRSLRTRRIDAAVSAVSRHALVRNGMLRSQRAAARKGATVMVGRDISSVVLPDATLKVYLTASSQVRAARRAAEMGRPDRATAYLAEIERRDALDSGRAVAPLRVVPGALVLDTGELSVEACVDSIVAHLP